MRKLILALVLAAVTCLTAVSVCRRPIRAHPGLRTVRGHLAASSCGSERDADQSKQHEHLDPGPEPRQRRQRVADERRRVVGRGGQREQRPPRARASRPAAAAIQSSTQSAATGPGRRGAVDGGSVGASNVNVPIRVLSPGNDGNVSQTNAVGSQATAGNCGDDEPVRDADSGRWIVRLQQQHADPDVRPVGIDRSGRRRGSQATQIDPSNTTVSVRVLSPGDDGSVSQANTVGSSAAAGNMAGTSQTQPADGCRLPSCGCSGTPVQQADQSASTGQGGRRAVGSRSGNPSNEASPVRVASDGNGGATRQENIAGSECNRTERCIDLAAGIAVGSLRQCDPGRVAGCVHGTGRTRRVGCSAARRVERRLAGAGLKRRQRRLGLPVATRSLSGAVRGQPGRNHTERKPERAAGTCGCGGAGIQVLGQRSDTDQAGIRSIGCIQAVRRALAVRLRRQLGGNTASPTRVGSAGDDGTTSQANNALLVGGGIERRLRRRRTARSRRPAAASQIQALGQQATTGQDAFAASLAAQLGASNDASPVRVLSPGGGGSVHQSNAAGSSAVAGNASGTAAGRPAGNRRRWLRMRQPADPGRGPVGTDAAGGPRALGCAAGASEQHLVADPRLEPVAAAVPSTRRTPRCRAATRSNRALTRQGVQQAA